MKTSPKQTSLLTEIESTFSQEDFPANLTAKRESEKEKTMTDISGQKCLEQFERLNQPGLWAKTFAGLLIGMEGWYSTKCSLTWKLLGTKSNRFYFQLVPSTLPIAGIESGLLLSTPSANPMANITEERAKEKGWIWKETSWYRKDGTKVQTTLSQQITQGLLPTPTTQEPTSECEVTDTGRRKTKDGKDSHSLNLGRMGAMGMLPTPNASDHPGKNTGKRNQDSLPKRIRDAGGKTSQLNPQFVAEMMGFPTNWTELPFQSGETNQSKPMETQ